MNNSATSVVKIAPIGNDLLLDHRHYEKSFSNTASTWITVYLLYIIGILTLVFVIGFFLIYAAMKMRPEGGRTDLPSNLKKESNQLRKIVELALNDTINS